MELSTNLGNKKIQILEVNNNIEDKDLQFFSNSQHIFFPGRSGKNFNLPKNGKARVNFILFPRSEKRKEAVLKCVDIEKREDFKSWLIKYKVLKPKFENIIEVDCIIGRITNFKYEFINPFDEEITLFFESNNEYFLNVVDNQMNFMGNQTKNIRFSASRQSQVGNKEVLVFVYDDESFSQTLLFKLKFSSS
jgi:hypothetical protein